MNVINAPATAQRPAWTRTDRCHGR